MANIDKKVDKDDVRVFFQTLCGELAQACSLCWLPAVHENAHAAALTHSPVNIQAR